MLARGVRVLVLRIPEPVLEGRGARDGDLGERGELALATISVAGNYFRTHASMKFTVKLSMENR